MMLKKDRNVSIQIALSMLDKGVNNSIVESNCTGPFDIKKLDVIMIIVLVIRLPRSVEASLVPLLKLPALEGPAMAI